MLSSTNRISSICAEVVEAKIAHEAALKEAAYLEEQKEQSRLFIENSNVSDSYTSIIESAIQISENSKKLFDTMIELDFVTSMRESANIPVNEEAAAGANDAKMKNIKNNINKICAGAKETVKSAGTKATKNTTKVFNIDNKMHNKYANALRKSDNLDGFKGITNFSIPTSDSSKAIDDIVGMKAIIDSYKKFANAVASAKSKEATDNATKYINKARTAASDSNVDKSKKAIPKKAKWSPSSRDITIIINSMNGNAIKHSIADNANKVVGIIESVRNNAIKAVDYIDRENSEFAVYKVNALYRTTSTIITFILTTFNMYLDLAAREAASYRKAFMICGRYASKADESSVNESIEEQDIYESVIGEASDLFVYDAYGIM